MKSFLTNYTIIAFVLALLFTGCEKNEQPVKNQNNGLSEEDLQTAEKIKSFLHQMENPQKSNDVLSVEDAVWNTEAGLNFSYGDGGSQINFVEVDSCFVDIALNGNGITMENLSQAYAMMEDSLLAFYNDFSGPRHIVAADVQPVESLEKSNTITFKTTTSLSRDPSEPVFPFQEWDYWAWGFSGGYCAGDSVNVQTDSDAAEQIMNRIHKSKGEIPGDYYYTDIQEEELWWNDHPNPNDTTNNDNYYDYLLFHNYEGYPNYHTCMTPDECNFYLEGTKTIIYHTANDTPPGVKPPNKDFISIYLYGELAMEQPVRIFHMGDAKYGILHQSAPPPTE